MSKYTSTTAPDNAAHGQARLEQEGRADHWQIVIADDMHLQFDYDDGEGPPKEFYVGLNLLRQRLGLKHPPEYRQTISRRGNCHVHITLPRPMQLLERVAWQAVCGSDPLREGIALINISRKHANPVLLFECKPFSEEIL